MWINKCSFMELNEVMKMLNKPQSSLKFSETVIPKVYVEVFPPLGWPFVKEDKDITINVSYQDTKQENLNPKGLYGLDANAGWIYLHEAVDQSGYYSFEYQVRRLAARNIYGGNLIKAEFSAFKVDKIE
jgi:hypothetical protein